MGKIEYVICEKKDLEKIATALRRVSGMTEQFSFDNLIGLTVNTINSTLPEITYTNQLPISTDANGNVYNGKGWKENTYLSSGNDGVREGIYSTGFIPLPKIQGYNANYYCKNVGMQTGQSSHRVVIYDANKQYYNDKTINTTNTSGFFFYGDDGNISYISIATTHIPEGGGYIRLCCGYLGEDSIIALNEEII